jgi:hypothetical protein
MEVVSPSGEKILLVHMKKLVNPLLFQSLLLSLTPSPPPMTTLTGQVQATLILGLQEMK